MSHGHKVLFGQMRAAGVPAYWQTAAVPQDGATAVAFRVESLPLGSAGTETVFREVTIAGRHSLGGTFRVDAVLDGQASPTESATIAGHLFTIEVLPVTFTLSIPPTGPAGTIEEQDFSAVVPLVRRLLIDGVEYGRWYLRGEQCGIRLTNVGALSAGSLAIDGAVMEHNEIRRADHSVTVAVTT